MLTEFADATGTENVATSTVVFAAVSLFALMQYSLLRGCTTMIIRGLSERRLSGGALPPRIAVLGVVGRTSAFSMLRP